jgi:hypothetical protein
MQGRMGTKADGMQGGWDAGRMGCRADGLQGGWDDTTRWRLLMSLLRHESQGMDGDLRRLPYLSDAAAFSRARGPSAHGEFSAAATSEDCADHRAASRPRATASG